MVRKLAHGRDSILLLLLSSTAVIKCTFLVPPAAARSCTRHAHARRHASIPSVRMAPQTIMDMLMPKELVDWGMPATPQLSGGGSVYCVPPEPFSQPSPSTPGMDEELWGKSNRNSRKGLLQGVKKGFTNEYGLKKVSKLREAVATAAKAEVAEETPREPAVERAERAMVERAASEAVRAVEQAEAGVAAAEAAAAQAVAWSAAAQRAAAECAAQAECVAAECVVEQAEAEVAAAEAAVAQAAQQAAARAAARAAATESAAATVGVSEMAEMAEMQLLEFGRLRWREMLEGQQLSAAEDARLEALWAANEDACDLIDEKIEEELEEQACMYTA